MQVIPHDQQYLKVKHNSEPPQYQLNLPTSHLDTVAERGRQTEPTSERHHEVSFNNRRAAG